MNLDNIKLKYNHPASMGFDLNRTYSLNKDEEGYYIQNNNKKIRINLDKVNALFDIVSGKEEFGNLQKQSKIHEKESKIEEKVEEITEIKEENNEIKINKINKKHKKSR